MGTQAVSGFLRQITAESSDLSHLRRVGEGVIRGGLGVYEFAGPDMDQPRRVDVSNSGAPISTWKRYSAMPILVRSPPTAQGLFQGSSGAAAAPIPPRVKSGPASMALPASMFPPPTATAPLRTPAALTAPPNQAAASKNFTPRRVTLKDLGAVRPNSSPRPPTAPASSSPPPSSSSTVTQTRPTTSITATSPPAPRPRPPEKPIPVLRSGRSPSPQSGAAEVEHVFTTSEDGSTVLFAAKGILAANEDALEEKAVAGDNNLYVWHQDPAHPAGQTSFVGRLERIRRYLRESRTEGAGHPGRSLRGPHHPRPIRRSRRRPVPRRLPSRRRNRGTDPGLDQPCRDRRQRAIGCRNWRPRTNIIRRPPSPTTARRSSSPPTRRFLRSTATKNPTSTSGRRPASSSFPPAPPASPPEKPRLAGFRSPTWPLTDRGKTFTSKPPRRSDGATAIPLSTYTTPAPAVASASPPKPTCTGEACQPEPESSAAQNGAALGPTRPRQPTSAETLRQRQGAQQEGQMRQEAPKSTSVARKPVISREVESENRSAQPIDHRHLEKGEPSHDQPSPPKPPAPSARLPSALCLSQLWRSLPRRTNPSTSRPSATAPSTLAEIPIPSPAAILTGTSPRFRFLPNLRNLRFRRRAPPPPTSSRRRGLSAIPPPPLIARSQRCLRRNLKKITKVNSVPAQQVLRSATFF